MEMTKDIKELKTTIEKGKFDLAFEQIEKILKKEELTDIEKIQAKLWKSITLFLIAQAEARRENIKLSFEILSKLLKESEKLEKNELIFDVLNWYNWCLWATSRNKEFVEGVEKQEELYRKLVKKDYLNLKEKEASLLVIKGNVGIAKAMIDDKYKWDNQESIKFLKDAVKLSLETDNNFLKVMCYSQLSTLYNMVADYDKVIDALTKTIDILEKMEDYYHKGLLLTQIGFAYYNKGEYEQLLDYTKQSLEVFDAISNERLKAQSYGMLGVYYGIKGERKEALEYTIKARNILTDDEQIGDSPAWLNNLATFYYDLGEIDKAIESMEKLFEILKKQKRELASMYSLANLSLFYGQKGELDKALEMQTQCVDFFSRIGEKGQLQWIYFAMSGNYDRKGLENKALEYLHRAQEIIVELDNKMNIAWIFYRFVLLSTKYGKLDLAKEYYKKLENIIEEIEYKNIKRLVLIAEGIILKKSTETRNRDRAEVLFDQLLQEDLDFHLFIEVLLHLCELLLVELKETSNERYLTKLQKNVSQLIDKGTKAKLPEIMIESLWFKSQLSLLELDVDKAREFLTKALDIAERKGYNRLALKITKAKEQLIKQKMELEDIEGESPKISKRMEIIEVENGFKELKQKNIFEFNIEKIDSSKKLFSIKI
jgi:tetratricopeptide (TPR) repeat protein